MPESAGPLSGWVGGGEPVSGGDTAGPGAVVVVAVSAGMPESCAADTAGTTQIAARTIVPVARALSPFIHLILRVIDS